MEEKIIQSALISVFSKDGIKPIVDELRKRDVTIYSTGGTFEYITKLGYKVTKVEDITCLLYTSPSPRDRQKSRMPSSA